MVGAAAPVFVRVVQDRLSRDDVVRPMDVGGVPARLALQDPACVAVGKRVGPGGLTRNTCESMSSPTTVQSIPS
jgi:hypothetical protein